MARDAGKKKAAQDRLDLCGGANPADKLMQISGCSVSKMDGDLGEGFGYGVELGQLYGIGELGREGLDGFDGALQFVHRAKVSPRDAADGLYGLFLGNRSIPPRVICIRFCVGRKKALHCALCELGGSMKTVYHRWGVKVNKSSGTGCPSLFCVGEKW